MSKEEIIKNASKEYIEYNQLNLKPTAKIKSTSQAIINKIKNIEEKNEENEG